jgi:hypothetical protein
MQTVFACNIPGDADGTPKSSFRTMIHFQSMEELLKHAGESVKRVLQQKYGRLGKFPTGRIVDVDAKGNFSKTEEEQMQEVVSGLGIMSPENRAAWLKEQLRLTEIHMSALAELVADDEKVVKVKKS